MKMDKSTEYSAIFNMLLVILAWCSETNAMVYQEAMNVEDLDSLFSEDDCIEGTLSTTESGGPLIRSISFVDSLPTTVGKAENSDFDEKSPMSLVSELATFNNIKYQYTLKEEDGPSHKKRFLISLLLGDHEYLAEGSSIKKAQHEAARLALNSTTYEHPPKITKKDKIPKVASSPVFKLNEWARKHSGVKIMYSYIQQSRLDHKNLYHKSMYSKAENVHRVTVTVGDQRFMGEGYSTETAKQNAAENALKQLQSAEGFCMFDDGVKDLFTKLFSSDSESQSPISLVFEFAGKSKLQASFDLVSEEGPAHIKKFVYKCNVGGEFETFGEGSSKKVAKTEAAKNMVEKLKSHSAYKQVDCGGSLMKRKSKKKKSRNLIKSVAQSTQEDMDYEYSIPEEMNPISKLMQIQQQKHDMQPVFRLVEENTQDFSNRFSIEVTVGELSFVGSGPNKKTAKRKAAEGILEKLGYSTAASGKTRLVSSDFKKKEFSDSSTLKKKPLVSGLNLNSEKFAKLDDASHSRDGNANEPVELGKKGTKSKDGTRHKQDKESNTKPKTELKKLAQQLGFRYQFSDFPKFNNTGFVSLVSLTTDPPKVCYGTGATTDQSQDRASLSALENLYKNQLNTVSQMLRETNLDASAKEGFYMVDGNNIVKTIISKETK
ncbi:Double-stranded RNA-binding protein Staufen 1 [Homalodisca vitripennis]|nr:Double-stranded RNA-binding protein Staufen 1 [Homalodisca vitripennis]